MTRHDRTNFGDILVADLLHALLVLAELGADRNVFCFFGRPQCACFLFLSKLDATCKQGFSLCVFRENKLYCCCT